MKEVDVPMVPHSACQTMLTNTPRLPRQFKLDKSFVCAGGEAGKDACSGDGGGPLVCPSPDTGHMQLAGLVSWGVGCGKAGVPGVYTNIATYSHWIRETINIL